MKNQSDDEMRVELTSWQEDYARYLRTAYQEDLSYMRRMYQITEDIKSVERIDKLIAMLKAPTINHEEVVDEYNDLNKEATKLFQSRDLLKLIGVLSPNFQKDGVLFSVMHSPEEWLKRTVNTLCGKIESMDNFTKGEVNFKEVAQFFRNKVEKTSDISIPYWTMLKQLFRLWDVITDAMTLMHEIPSWFNDGKPNEKAVLDKAKLYIKHFDWIERIYVPKED